MSINEEIFQRVFRQDLLHALAHKLPGRRAGNGNREAPLSRRTVPALRQPNATRPSAKKPAMRLHSGHDLRADRSVRSQQREISVCGSAGNNLDSAGVIEPAEAADDIAAEIFELAQCILVKLAPEVRDRHHVRFAVAAEVVNVLDRGLNLSRQVDGKLLLENRM